MSGLRALLSLERLFLATALLGAGLGVVAVLLYARTEPAAAVVVRLPGHVDPHPRFPGGITTAPRPAPANPAGQDTAELVVGDASAAAEQELEGDGIGRVLAETATGGEEPGAFFPPAPAEPEPALPPAAEEPPPAPTPPETPADDQYGDPAAEPGDADDEGDSAGVVPGELLLPLPGAATP